MMHSNESNIKNRIFEKDLFLKKWLKTFAPEMTAEQYDRYVKGQYIWHTFSWDIISKEKYLKGEAARKAYDKADKSQAMCFKLWYDEKLSALTAEFDTAEKIESADCPYPEFYVVGKNFSWTYIATHEIECGCGPYFMKAQQD